MKHESTPGTEEVGNPYAPPEARNETKSNKLRVFRLLSLWVFVVAFVLPSVASIVSIPLSEMKVIPANVIIPSIVISLFICSGAIFSGRCKMRWKVLLAILTFVLLPVEVIVTLLIAKEVIPNGF